MALFNAVLIGELFFLLWSARTLFKLMTAINLYCLLYDMYTALASQGILALSFVFLVNSPYLLALTRYLAKVDSVHRRRHLFEVCRLS